MHIKANIIAWKNGWAEFISIQNNYNEEEREMFQLLEEEKIVMTPYSPLSAGRVCRLLYTDEKTKRSSDVLEMLENMNMLKMLIFLLYKELKKLMIN